MDYLNLENLLDTYLTLALSDSATTMQVMDDLDIDVPFVAAISRGRDLGSLRDAEEVRVSNIADKIWTISRGYNGSTAREHDPGELVLLTVSSAHHKMMLGTLEFLSYAFGRGASGIIRRDAADPGNFKVSATTGMVVAVNSGLAFINRKPFKLAADTTLTVVAPTTNSRIALVQLCIPTYTVSLKYGTQAGSPVAPAADTDCLGIAEVATTVGMTEIVQGNITDRRVYY